MRHLVFAELNLHMASVGDALGVLHRFPCIGEKSLHLLLTLHIVLPAFIAHTILVRQLLASLQTEQNIVGLRILRIGVMHVIRRHQRDIQFSAHR